MTMLGFSEISFDQHLISPVYADEVPLYSCATATRGVTDYQWIFKNSCGVAVYWTISCMTGNSSCYGSGRLGLQPGKEITQGYVGMEIDGPHRQ
jgi:hypothetical protein